MAKTRAHPETPVSAATHGEDPVAKLYDLLPLATIVTDGDGKVVHANAKARECGLVGPGPVENSSELIAEGLVRADGTALAAAGHPAVRLQGEGLSQLDERIGVCRSGQPTRWLQATATAVPGLGFVSTYIDVSVSRQTEDDLHHSIDQLDAFFTSNLDLLAILNSEGRAIRLNPAWNACLGYERGSIDYARVLDLVHPSDTETTLGALARLRTPAEVVSFVNRIRHHHGGYRMFEWRATARDDLVYASARDITEQREAEAALRASEQRFRAIFEQAAVGVAEVDLRSGRFIQINQRFHDIVGYTSSELEGRTFRSLSHSDGLDDDLAAAKSLVAGEVSEYRREKRYVHKDGHSVWVDLQVRSIVDPATGIRRGVNVVQDITARKEAEAQLRKALADALDANQRLSFQSSRMPLACIAWDCDFRVTEWNEAAERIFGWPAKEAIGRHAHELILPPEVQATMQPLWNRLLENDGSAKTVVNGNCTRDGRRITCEWFNAPLFDASGKVIGVLSMAHDITERLHLEESLRQNRRMESLASFAGGVAHDANNVLNSIAKLAHAMANSPSDPEHLHKSLSAILQACGKGRSLIRGLLDFTRNDLANATALNLHQVLEDQIGLLGSALPANVHVEQDFDPSMGTIEGDANALAAAFMHLILNALDAMPNGGTLTLRTRVCGKNEVVIEVRDTGVGMSEGVREHAMDPLFTTKPQSQQSGLGLPAVYGVAKAHGGRVEIQSEPGKGTRVQLVLPLTPAATTTPPDAHDQTTTARKLRILVVDDDDLVQATVSAQLRRLGHSVTLADHGQAALDRIREGLEFDLVLLDINMPVLDGARTLPLLRDLRPKLPVIIETGGTGESAMALASAYPDVSVLCRPFTTGELKAAITPWLTQARD